MKKKLYIIGAGSVGGHVAHNIDDYEKKYEIVGFLDDDPAKGDSEMFGYPVIGSTDYALTLNNVYIVVGIAFPNVKQAIIKKLHKNRSLKFPTLIHEDAWVSREVSIGEGSVVYPGSCINYGSKIGSFVVMNMNCSLGHHTTIGNFASLAPNVSTGGHTTIQNLVDVGIGASTLQNVTIGEASIIGGKSMVVSDVKPNLTVKGVPAR